MILKQLNLVNFKSLSQARFTFSRKLNCFIGNNGMGKTNILDALHYLSLTKSHLGLKDSFAVKHGESFTSLDANYSNDQGVEFQILLQMRLGQRKIIKKNKKEYERLSDHIGQLPLVIISPQDYQLILGGSKERQRFIDVQLCQQDPVYLSALSQYNKSLQQRNTLLKNQEAKDSILDILDQQMNAYAQTIWLRRKAFVEDFEPLFQTFYSAIAREPEQIKLAYHSSLSSEEGSLLAILQQNRAKDKVLGYTSEGVHKDDLSMFLGKERIKDVGSEGQKKTFLISLKLAQYKMFALQGGEQPMLLLDDIFDKLDAERVKNIIELVGGESFGQIFITDTNLKYLDEIIRAWGDDYALFSVKLGNVQKLDSSEIAKSEEE